MRSEITNQWRGSILFAFSGVLYSSVRDALGVSDALMLSIFAFVACRIHTTTLSEVADLLLVQALVSTYVEPIDATRGFTVNVLVELVRLGVGLLLLAYVCGVPHVFHGPSGVLSHPVYRVLKFAVALTVERVETQLRLGGSLSTILWVIAGVLILCDELRATRTCFDRLCATEQLVGYFTCIFAIVTVVNFAAVYGVYHMLFLQLAFVYYFERVSLRTFLVVKPVAVWKTAHRVAEYISEKQVSMDTLLLVMGVAVIVVYVTRLHFASRDFVIHTVVQSIIYVVLRESQRVTDNTSFFVLLLISWTLIDAFLR